MISKITSHVLDTSMGKPARGISTRLEKLIDDVWTEIGSSETDADGRINNLIAKDSVEPGIYRIRFDTGSYFSQTGQSGFYPMVCIEFQVIDADQHYHIPLLLNPFGYSTYRGS